MPRKVAGSEQGLENLGRIAAMGLMGVGGLLFVVIVLRAVYRPKTGR